MRKPLYFGLPALAVATSCVPIAPTRSGTSQAVPAATPITDSRTLLKKLALDVPADLHGVTLGPTMALPDAAPAFSLENASDDDAERAAECLTQAIYYEARSEPVDGQRAVAQVVLNRVRDRAFPKSVCGVVYQGSERRTGCQFSFTCDGSMNRQRDFVSWQRARAVAEQALSGFVYAPVGSATFYHANYVSPWWAPSLARIGAIGSHIFYTWKSAMENALTFRQAYAGREPDPSGFALGGDGGGVSEVAVHVGGDPDSLVTVHRGMSAPATTLAEADDQPATPRLLTALGVRVHRGTDPHSGDDADFASDVGE